MHTKDGFDIVAPSDDIEEDGEDEAGYSPPTSSPTEEEEEIPDYLVNSLVDIDGTCVGWLARDKA